jgi:hypothetical protein
VLVSLPIVGLILVAVLALVFRGLSDDEIGRRGQPKLSPGGAMILERGPSSRTYYAIMLLLFAGIAIFIIVGALRTPARNSLGLGILFAALCLTMVPETLRAWDRIEATDEMVSRESLLRTSTSIRWNEIVDIRYRRIRRQLVLTGPHGAKIVVDVATNGFPTFVSLLIRRLPPMISRDALHRLPIALLNE